MLKNSCVSVLLNMAAFCFPCVLMAAFGGSPYAGGYQNYNDGSSAFDREDNTNYEYRWEDHNGREDSELRGYNRYNSGYNREYSTPNANYRSFL